MTEHAGRNREHEGQDTSNKIHDGQHHEHQSDHKRQTDRETREAIERRSISGVHVCVKRE